MGPLARLLCRRSTSLLSIPKPNSRGFGPSAIFRSLASGMRGALDKQTAEKPSPWKNPQRTVAVFWDLDNKPPKRVLPFEAASRLKEVAGKFGEVVDLVAYANHHAFSHVPTWVHEERRQRKVLDVLEASGEVKPEQPYVCGVCGAKKKTHAQLTKHFKMLHEKEQLKRINRLESLKAKKKQKERFRANNSMKMAKYKDAARGIILPAVGYGLMQEIRRAGVYVRTVKDTPQAADIALKDHMMRSIQKGVKCICLVSDDTDFKPQLKMAKERSLYTVVVGDLRILGAYADTYFSWAEVASGRAEQKARLVNRHLLVGEIGDVPINSISPVKIEELAVSEFKPLDPEEFLEQDSDSESGSDDSDDDEGWRPVDRYVDVDYNPSFDSFSDCSSESDLEEADRESTDVEMPPNLHGCLTKSKAVGNKSIQARTGVRRFTTKCEVVCKISSEAGKDALRATEFNAPKPERLHHFFTMRESANQGHSLSKVTAAMSDIGAEENGGHFQRVQDILRSSFPSERENDVNVKNGMEGIRESLSHQFGVSRSDMEGERLESNGEQQIPSSSANSGGEKDESGKQKKRRKIRKSVPGKSRVIKVVHVGPRPFYMSGFASESQEDCDAVNKYYAEFWEDEEEVYRGRQDRKRKK